MAKRKRVRLIPGANLFRLVIVTMLAGLALLTLVGSVVMFMFWLETRDGALLPSQGQRAWDAIEVLHDGSRVIGLALIALAAIWTFVAVANVRMASGRRRNPLIAAASWPAAAVGFWMLADRYVVDQAVGVIIIGYVAQAFVIYVPFFLLERAADAVDARRTPLRMTYLAGVVLAVYIQALGGLATIQESPDTDFGRLAGVLALGALLQALFTLAVTEACRTLESATEHETDLHNALVDQREAVTRRHAEAGQPTASPAPRSGRRDGPHPMTTPGDPTGGLPPPVRASSPPPPPALRLVLQRPPHRLHPRSLRPRSRRRGSSIPAKALNPSCRCASTRPRGSSRPGGCATCSCSRSSSASWWCC